MFNYQINAIVNKMIVDGIIAPNNTENAFISIKEYFSDKIAMTWTAEDILTRAGEINIDITDEQAVEILSSLQDNFNTNIRINWNIIDDYIIDCRDNAYLYNN